MPHGGRSRVRAESEAGSAPPPPDYLQSVQPAHDDLIPYPLHGYMMPQLPSHVKPRRARGVCGWLGRLPWATMAALGLTLAGVALVVRGVTGARDTVLQYVKQYTPLHIQREAEREIRETPHEELIYLVLVLVFWAVVIMTATCSGLSRESCGCHKRWRRLIGQSVLLILMGAGVLVFPLLLGADVVLVVAAGVVGVAHTSCGGQLTPSLTGLHDSRVDCQHITRYIREWTELRLVERVNASLALPPEAVQYRASLLESVADLQLLPADLCHHHCPHVAHVHPCVMRAAGGAILATFGLLLTLMALAANWAHLHDHMSHNEEDYCYRAAGGTSRELSSLPRIRARALKLADANNHRY